MVAVVATWREHFGRPSVPGVPLYALDDRQPSIHPDAFVHPDAVIIGDVRVGDRVVIGHLAHLEGCRVEASARIYVDNAARFSRGLRRIG